MSKIELHTIATFEGKEYELEELLNGLLNNLEARDKEIKRLNNVMKEFEKWLEENDKWSTTLKPTIYIGEIKTKLNQLKEGKPNE